MARLMRTGARRGGAMLEGSFGGETFGLRPGCFASARRSAGTHAAKETTPEARNMADIWATPTMLPTSGPTAMPPISPP